MKSLVAEKYNVKDPQTIFIFGCKSDFGGKKSTGFACIYNTVDDALRFEPRYRLVRQSLAVAKTGSTKARKEAKNKRKKLYATQKDKGKKRRKGGDDD